MIELLKKLKLDKKGFLFTISVIIFASTLVTFAQIYSESNLDVETRILKSYKPTAQFFINDNIASDLSDLFDQKVSMDILNGQVSFEINDSISKNYSIQNELNNYENFLENILFTNTSEFQDINLDNLKDGDIELFFSKEFNYINDYDNNKFIFNSNNDLNSIDLNLVHDNLNLQSYSWTGQTGNIPINIFFSNDTNSVTINKNISSTSASELWLNYSDKNILVRIGEENNSFFIDSNVSGKLSITLNLIYNFDDVNYMPIYYNAFLRYSSSKLDSNSNLKLFG